MASCVLNGRYGEKNLWRLLHPTGATIVLPSSTQWCVASRSGRCWMMGNRTDTCVRLASFARCCSHSPRSLCRCHHERSLLRGTSERPDTGHGTTSKAINNGCRAPGYLVRKWIFLWTSPYWTAGTSNPVGIRTQASSFAVDNAGKLVFGSIVLQQAVGFALDQNTAALSRRW